MAKTRTERPAVGLPSVSVGYHHADSRSPADGARIRDAVKTYIVQQLHHHLADTVKDGLERPAEAAEDRQSDRRRNHLWRGDRLSRLEILRLHLAESLDRIG
jgi:hypothetical protein